jgi:endonuclease YncB( thermonuclease family)
LIPGFSRAQIPTPKENKPFNATVIEVISGDTVVYERNNSRHILRLDGIVGIPSEFDMFGARKYLEKTLLNKRVTILTLGGMVSDNEKETLFGDLFIDNNSVRQLLINAGHAMVPNSSGNTSHSDLLDLQIKAQGTARGVWSDTINPAIYEWRVQVCGDNTVDQLNPIPAGEFASQGSTEIGWGSLGKTCSRIVWGQTCKKVFGKKFCWPTMTVQWAEQRWYLYKDESFEWSTINQQWLESIMQSVGFDKNMLQTPVPVLKDTFVSSLKQVADQCAVEGIGVAGITSFYTSPATAFPVWFNYTWNCVTARGPAAVSAAIAAKVTGVPNADALIQALVKASREYLDTVIRGTSFRIATKCLW